VSGRDPADVGGLADTVTELGALAMAFGRIDRTCCYHASGEKESDADHTVMLSWVAPSLAAKLYPASWTSVWSRSSLPCTTRLRHTPVYRFRIRRRCCELVFGPT
jgi:hypothetical protein